MDRSKKFLSTLLVAALTGLSVISSLLAQDQGLITRPQAGEMIENRKKFPVQWSIASYKQDRDQRRHYWISLASVTDTGKPNLHWPKFYIKEAAGAGSIYDGNTNPFSKPQPMIILLLKVDDGTNSGFEAWLKKGSITGTWEGIPVDQNQIVAKMPILFP